jgi:hypothetical protein
MSQQSVNDHFGGMFSVALFHGGNERNDVIAFIAARGLA